MKKRAIPILLLACGLAILACWMMADSGTPRQRELAAVLKPLLQPASGSIWSDEEEPPGWFDATNRQVVRDFVAKYPETEEAYQAEVWLAMAGANTERDPVRTAAECRQAVAGRLEIISHATARAGTRKMAELEQAFLLFQDEPGDHAEFYRQAEVIISHIQDFKSERDAAFRRYLEVVEVPANEIEPTLRLLMAHEKGMDGQLKQALGLARELKEKFPGWKSQSVNGLIEMDELYLRGWTLGASVRAK